MRCNVGKTDKTVRIILGLVFIIAGYLLPNFIDWKGFYVLAILGVILIITSALGFCPLYLPFGINTDEDAQNERKK